MRFWSVIIARLVVECRSARNATWKATAKSEIMFAFIQTCMLVEGASLATSSGSAPRPARAFRVPSACPRGLPGHSNSPNVICVSRGRRQRAQLRRKLHFACRRPFPPRCGSAAREPEIDWAGADVNSRRSSPEPDGPGESARAPSSSRSMERWSGSPVWRARSHLRRSSPGAGSFASSCFQADWRLVTIPNVNRAFSAIGLDRSRACEPQEFD